MAFDQSTRNRLQKFVAVARQILAEEFTRQLQATFGLDPQNGTVADLSTLRQLDNRQKQTAVILRDTLAHYVANSPARSEKESIRQNLERIVREQAFTVLNRMAALRMAEARGFLIESISKGYSSKGFQLYRQLAGSALGETGDAYRQYLFSIFDEFSLDLAVLFDRYSMQGHLFPREKSLLALLEQINHFEVEAFWYEDETIGWIYQFWNARTEIDSMREASRSPQDSREMAVRNQFFTPRYVVEFLTDNTLGRIWYEMTQGQTSLVDHCRYLVRRPNEIFLERGEMVPDGATQIEDMSQEDMLKQPFYVAFRPLKDPRDILMLDPACGSMHFGLYAFDLYERIYEEAWHIEESRGEKALLRDEGKRSLHATFDNFSEFKKLIPKLIIENNIHGVDIDPRAVQIAGLSLWQRAQKAWQKDGIRQHERPVIKKSNIVCAEPMPGEKALLKDFTDSLNPPLLGKIIETIFDKMQLAGEAGSLLKIEEEITDTIKSAREEYNRQLLRHKQNQGFLPGLGKPKELNLIDLAELPDQENFWNTAETRIVDALREYAEQAESDDGGKRLFAGDCAKGFAIIDLWQKQFDVALMNPPFGEASTSSKKYIDEVYPNTKGDVLANFLERVIAKTRPTGLVGAITSRTCLFLSTMSDLRSKVFGMNGEIELCADLGDGVLDAMVETAAYVVGNSLSTSVFLRLVTEEDKEKELLEACRDLTPGKKVFVADPKAFKKLNDAPYTYWVDKIILDKLELPSIDPAACGVKVGLQTGDDFRFLRNFWEVPINSENWVYYSKTEEAIPWYSPIQMKVLWTKNGYELKNFYDNKGKIRSRPQNIEAYFLPGFSYMLRSSRLVPYIVPRGCIPTAGRSQVFPLPGKEIEVLGIFASNVGSAVARFRGEMFARPKFQAGMVQQLPYVELTSKTANAIEQKLLHSVELAKAYYMTDETTLNFSGCHGISTQKQLEANFASLLDDQNEMLIASEFGLSFEEYEKLTLDLRQAISLRKEPQNLGDAELLNMAALRFCSFVVGCAFGRWSVAKTAANPEKDIYAELPDQAPAFKEQSKGGYISLFGIAGLDSSSHSLLAEVENLQQKLCVEFDFALTITGFRDWKMFLTNTNGFFDYHFNQYSQNRRYSPIYWPIQTKSGSFTIWLYYHRLDKQTLYLCANDFVEPKLKNIEVELSALRSKQSRSKDEEKEYTKLVDFEVELKDFRDELLRVARFWRPNLNDGVQITAAPLWKLFQHKPWQKKLKETWEKLEKGEFDWAHLALTIWPERVLRKCHCDRSLAIAHDVEEFFWQEIEVPVKRGKKVTEETVFEWRPKNLSENQLKTIVDIIIAKMQK